MQAEKICKTIHQYNQRPVSEEDMEKLLEIAADYRQVKNYVYERYGGIKSLSKLYPGYTVQNEMTESGLRGQLGMPSVYFYRAVFDALGDIKSQWTRTKKKVLGLVGKNERFRAEEKHYLRFVLKVSNAFEAILEQKEMKLPKELEKRYAVLAEQVDTEKLQKYLCRQVRKYHVKQHAEYADGFAVTERAYRYGEHGIYLAVKEKRKRIFIPLTDGNAYKCQLYVKLLPKENNIEIKVPIQMSVKQHPDYQNVIGIAIGMKTMFTTDEGHVYGARLGELSEEYALWMQEKMIRRSKEKKNNTGRKKYDAKRQRLEERLHSYMNHEINRLLQEEKPRLIYIPKLPKPQAGGVDKKMNYLAGRWQRGYVKKRLLQKCRERGVKLTEVFAKDISRVCSQCGAEGIKKEGMFSCKICGYQIEEKTNTAGNVKRRGQEGKQSS